MAYIIEFERRHTSDRAVTVRIIDPTADSSVDGIIAETIFEEGLPGGLELKDDEHVTFLQIHRTITKQT